MGQDRSLEEVMQKIRARVGLRGAGTSLATPSMPQLNRSDGSSAAVSVPRVEVAANDLAPLHAEIDTALEGTRRVGQINPRNPGLFNAVIQFVKKVMRRSLTWYTRPIHYFQGGAIRALQQTETLLQSHERTLRTLSQEFNRQSELIETRSADLSRQAAASGEAIAELQKAAATLGEGVSGTGSRMTALEQELQVLGDKAAGLQASLSALTERAQVVDQRLDETNAEVAARLERASAEVAVRLERASAEVAARLERASADVAARLESTTVELTAKLGDSISTQDQNFGDRLGAYGDMIAGVKGDIEELRTALAGLGDGLRRAQQQGRLRDRDLRRFFHELQGGPIAAPGEDRTPPVPPMFPTGVHREKDFDYFGFEDLYRGDEADIGRRQETYLEYFRGRQNVLDVGCGRGEFLELLRDNKITARGVELGTDQYLLCKEKGLDVTQQDLFSYLESLPDESLGGLFSAQVIEHLTASDQLRYVVVAYQKTSPGSPVIFETINAQCVWAVMRNFFLDPTHVRPLHPETLKFAMETVKFKDVELLFSSPLKERQIPPLQLPGDMPNLAEFNQRIAQLNELLYGDQDYAAIGWH